MTETPDTEHMTDAQIAFAIREACELIDEEENWVETLIKAQESRSKKDE